MNGGTAQAARMLEAAVGSATLLADTFEIWRVRDVKWHDAKPEFLHRCFNLEDAMSYGQAAIQPKQKFFIRRTSAITGKAVDSFYTVRETGKHTVSRKAYDGPYDVRMKGRVCEHWGDVAVMGHGQ